MKKKLYYICLYESHPDFGNVLECDVIKERVDAYKVDIGPCGMFVDKETMCYDIGLGLLHFYFYESKEQATKKMIDKVESNIEIEKNNIENLKRRISGYEMILERLKDNGTH